MKKVGVVILFIFVIIGVIIAIQDVQEASSLPVVRVTQPLPSNFDAVKFEECLKWSCTVLRAGDYRCGLNMADVVTVAIFRYSCEKGLPLNWER